MVFASELLQPPWCRRSVGAKVWTDAKKGFSMAAAHHMIPRNIFYWENRRTIHVFRHTLNAAPIDYSKTSNLRRTLVGNKIVDHSDVVGASPVGAAPATRLNIWLQGIRQRQPQDSTIIF